jgi:hypothetical protein
LGIAAPARAQDAAAVEERLLAELAGYELAPESDQAFQGSGPLTAADFADLSGTDPDQLPGEMTGYVQLFFAPSGAAAWAMGIEVGGPDLELFLGGFNSAGAGQGEAIDLLPEASGPLGELTAYEVPNPVDGSSAVLTAFGADDLGVVLGVRGVAGEPLDDDIETLRTMVQQQADLTAPAVVNDGSSDSSGSAGDDSEDAARSAGRVVGQLLVLAVLVGIVVLVVRAIGRRRRPTTPPFPGYQPYPQPPPSSGFPPPPQQQSPGYPPQPPPPPSPPPGSQSLPPAQPPQTGRQAQGPEASPPPQSSQSSLPAGFPPPPQDPQTPPQPE